MRAIVPTIPLSMKRPGTAMTPLQVALVQRACQQDAATNLHAIRTLLEPLRGEKIDLLVLPELHNGPYFCVSEEAAQFERAEPIPGPSTTALGQLARELNAVVIGSLFERRAAGLYHNSAVVLERDGSLAGCYRKMHIPDDPLFYEKFYFTPGDTGFKAWKTRYATIGVLVCWDQWYPEAARLTALQGAEILFYPTAIGWHPSEKQEYGKAQHDSWELIQRSHAVANGCFVCAPNRIGHELVLGPNGKPVSKDGIQFWGQSFIAAPNGQVLHRASIGKPEAVVVDCNLDLVEAARTHWPFLRDRRIDAYGALTQRFSD